MVQSAGVQDTKRSGHGCLPGIRMKETHHPGCPMSMADPWSPWSCLVVELLGAGKRAMSFLKRFMTHFRSG